MRQLRLLLIVCSLPFLGAASCPRTPVKPTLTVYDVDYPRMEAIKTRKVPGLPAEKLGRVPLSEVDKGKCLLPLDHEQYQNYIDALEENYEFHQSLKKEADNADRNFIEQLREAQ